MGARTRRQRPVAGEAQLVDLDDDERRAANARLDSSISIAANSAKFADRLNARGSTAVVMDGEGGIIRRHPDGSTTVQ